MRIIGILLLTLFCTALVAQKKNNKKKGDEEPYPLKMRVIMGKQLDSLIVNPTIAPLAVQLVQGKKALNADKATFAILDSAAKADVETRPLYIHILAYANLMAETDLSEMLGKYNIQLLQNYPKDVLRYFKKGETDERVADAQYTFEQNIAFELNNADDPKTAFNDLVDKVFEKYKSKNSEEIDRLLKGVKKAMK
jgi:NAD-specific glutamate dehydrogenase